MKTKSLILLLLILPFLVKGQKEDFVPPSFILPSPTAFELGLYGYANVGMHTGTASSSIPLYNYSAGKLSVPISLSYSSNGIKVDQLSSNVGQGWSLNAGGVITRIVMGKSDQDNALLWSQDDIDNAETITTAQQTAIDNASSASDADTDTTSENTLRVKLALLRDAFPDALVTTYTYDPLIGVTSITDPKGQTTYYQYDQLGRLELVKDKNLDVLSKNEYHYKTQ